MRDHMKIGAGGLQNLVMQEIAARQSEPVSRTKPVPDPLTMQEQQYGRILFNEKDLHKAVEHLNHYATVYNYQLKFKIIRIQGKLKIKVTNKDKQEQVVSVEEFERIAEGLISKKGQNLDGYA